MFTGIIEELGTVQSLTASASSSRLSIEARAVLTDLRVGASIAVNGVCLTAVHVDASSFSADLAPETLQRTNLGDLVPGAKVNLERPLSPSGRLDGHILQGHVDATGLLVSLDPLGDGNWWLKVEVPPEAERYLVFKGSVAVDGISLTVASLAGRELGIAIIPHTYQMTTLGSHQSGDRLNLECDIIAKYVEKFMQPGKDRPIVPLTTERLREEGF